MAPKILYRKLIHPTGQSFSYAEKAPLTVPLHSHDEYELIYIVAGSGYQYIGSSVEPYRAGELVLIGHNVPHLNLCQSVIDKTVTEKSVCEILQFPRELFPESSCHVKEYEFINSILDLSSRGAKFHSESVVKEALRLMSALNKKGGIERVTLLFRILDLLGRSKETTYFSDRSDTSYVYDEPIHKVNAYLTFHFKKKITLAMIAEHANLPATSLCRYFKQRTGKTIIGCLNERRVEYACKLLSHSDKIIEQIGYEAGFNNISNFNKQFKKITRQTPKVYRKNLSAEVK